MGPSPRFRRDQSGAPPFVEPVELVQNLDDLLVGVGHPEFAKDPSTSFFGLRLRIFVGNVAHVKNYVRREHLFERGVER